MLSILGEHLSAQNAQVHRPKLPLSKTIGSISQLRAASWRLLLGDFAFD
jgi:hypothetical protein